MDNINEGQKDVSCDAEEQVDKKEQLENMDKPSIDEASNENIDNISLKDTFLASLIDVVLTGVVSTAILFLLDGILRITAGYYISAKISMLAIIYLIVFIIYTSIMESSKNANTIGKRAANLKIIKAK